jgi:hypothetical protein
VKGPKGCYREEEVEGLLGVQRFVMEYLQNFNNVLANEQRAGVAISGEKSNWC